MSKPAVFISYARQDLGLAKKFESALSERGFSVWRDQESIYAGENWPKAIGEAISSRSYVLLLWSRNAGKSHFVEFEWSTAIALKKQILPILVDETDLDPSLRTFHGIPLNDFNGTLAKILKSLERKIPQKDAPREQKVLKKLKQIEAAKPQEAVKEVQNIVKQEAKNVKGTVYQAGGDINIGVEQKNPFLKWYYGVAFLAAFLAAILTIVKISTDLFNNDPENGADLHQIVEEQVLAGTIWDDEGEPLGGVTLYLPNYELETQTDNHGKFKFVIKDEPKQKLIDLHCTMDGLESKEMEARLGDSSYNFTLRRKP